MFTQEQQVWIDADYDGPLPDGAVLKHSSKPYNKSSGHYTLKLIHGSINESASRFKVYTAKGLGADEAKARAMARLKKGESKDFNFLVGYIERNAVSEGGGARRQWDGRRRGRGRCGNSRRGDSGAAPITAPSCGEAVL